MRRRPMMDDGDPPQPNLKIERDRHVGHQGVEPRHQLDLALGFGHAIAQDLRRDREGDQHRDGEPDLDRCLHLFLEPRPREFRHGAQ